MKVLLILKILLPAILGIILLGWALWILFRQSAGLVLRFHGLPSDYEIFPLLLRRLAPAYLDKLIPKTFIILPEGETLPDDHWARWLGGPATLVINDGLAVYLEQYGKFSRIAGPGLPLTELMRHETIKFIIDLRPQMVRKENIKAWAKDGIQVQYTVKAEIQVAASEEARKMAASFEKNKRENGEKKLVYAFDTDAVKRTVERITVAYNHEKKSLEQRTWIEGSAGTITGRINAYIAGQSINEIMFQDENSPQLFSFTVTEELFENINRSLSFGGVQLLSLQITNFSPVDDQISKGLLTLWSTEREKQNNIRKGEDDARRIRASQRAQTISQQELLDSLIENLSEMNDDISASGTASVTFAQSNQKT